MPRHRHRLPRPRSRRWWAWATLNVAVLLVVRLVQQHASDTSWPVTILTYLPQHPLAVPTVLLLAVALVRRDARASLFALLTLAAFLVVFLNFNMPPRRVTQSAPGLRVMTYNVGHAADHAAVTRAVIEASPDVLCLQEATPALVSRLAAHLNGYSVVRGEGVTTLTRFPLLGSKATRWPWSNQTMLEVTVRLGDQEIRVMNVHLSGTRVQDIPNAQYRRRGVAFRLRRSLAERHTELTTLLREAADGGPLIVAGDFNTPPRGELYATLASRLTDAFAQAGWGFGNTYSSRWPVVRIDHVWFSSDVQAVRAWVPPVMASDHRPLMAVLSVNTP